MVLTMRDHCETIYAMKRSFVKVRIWNPPLLRQPRADELCEQIRRHEAGMRVARAQLAELMAANQFNRG